MPSGQQSSFTEIAPLQPLFMNYVVQSAFSLGIPVWFVWFFFIKTKTEADYQPQITKSLIISSIWFTALLSGIPFIIS